MTHDIELDRQLVPPFLDQGGQVRHGARLGVEEILPADQGPVDALGETRGRTRDDGGTAPQTVRLQCLVHGRRGAARAHGVDDGVKAVAVGRRGLELLGVVLGRALQAGRGAQALQVGVVRRRAGGGDVGKGQGEAEELDRGRADGRAAAEHEHRLGLVAVGELGEPRQLDLEPDVDGGGCGQVGDAIEEFRSVSTFESRLY